MSRYTSYCSRHLMDYALGTMCPECRRDQADEAQQELIELQRESAEALRESQWEAERQRDALADSIRQAEYRRLNPGNYQCDACKLMTLLDGASRCPTCRSDVHRDYWPSVRAREQRAREGAQASKQKAEDAKTRACEAAVAIVKLGTAHTERLWWDQFEEAKKEHEKKTREHQVAMRKYEAQGSFSRMFASQPPPPPPAPSSQRKYSFYRREFRISNRRWTSQPVISLGITNIDTGQRLGFKDYRFATPPEYIAVCRYLTTVDGWNAPGGADAAIATFQGLDQDWPAQAPVAEAIGEVTPDYAAALQRHREGAARGDAMSQYELGRIYAMGQGVARDYGEALKWYRVAAEQGNAGAVRNIGVMYYFGQAVAEDRAEAMRWYQRAGEKGDARAFRFIGLMYDDGAGVTKDYSEALKWYRKAADQGDAWAMRHIGDLYHRGKGASRDNQEALMWFRKAVGAGDAEAALSAQFSIDLIGGKFDPA